MSNKSISFVSMTLSLGLFCLFSGLLLAWFHAITRQPIADAEMRQRELAVGEVLPSYDNSPIAGAVKVAVGADSFMVYPAYLDDKLVGAAVESFSFDGFAGEIRVIFGFDAAGTVVGYKVLAHAETPGLGDKMGQWFRSEGSRSVIGLDPAAPTSKLSKDGGQIDGITAATITSRAFVSAMALARQAFDAYCSTIQLSQQ